MKVWVVEQYSYEPESPLGVYSTQDKAVLAMIDGGYSPREDYYGEGATTWHDRYNWLQARVSEYELDV